MRTAFQVKPGYYCDAEKYPELHAAYERFVAAANRLAQHLTTLPEGLEVWLVGHGFSLLPKSDGTWELHRSPDGLDAEEGGSVIALFNLGSAYEVEGVCEGGFKEIIASFDRYIETGSAEESVQHDLIALKPKLVEWDQNMNCYSTLPTRIDLSLITGA